MATLTLSKTDIQAFILANKTLNALEISEQLNIPFRVATANIATLRRWGKLEPAPKVVKEKQKRGRKGTQFKAKKAAENRKRILPVVGEFTNYEGKNKKDAREKMVNAIVESRLSSGFLGGDILSLPAEEFLLEKEISKYISTYRYFGVECEEKPYFKLLGNLAKERFLMNTYKGKISDIIFKSKENEFSHLILDYCGILSHFSEEIKYAVLNNVVEVGGTISVTFNKREVNVNFTTEILGLNNVTKEMVQDEGLMNHVITSFFQRLCGFNYKLIERFDYHDTSAMSLVIIKRIS